MNVFFTNSCIIIISITGCPCPITVRVVLVRVRGQHTVVTDISYPILISIPLIPIFFISTIVLLERLKMENSEENAYPIGT